MKEIEEKLKRAEALVLDAEQVVEYKEDWKNKKVMNPASKRMVKVGSLPPDEQEKYRPKDGDVEAGSEKKPEADKKPEKVTSKSSVEYEKEFKGSKISEAKVIGGGTSLPIKVKTESGHTALMKPFYRKDGKDAMMAGREVKAANLFSKLGWNDNAVPVFVSELEEDIDAGGVQREIAKDALASGQIVQGKDSVKVKKGTKGSYQEFRKATELKSVIESGDKEKLKELVDKVKPEDVIRGAQFDLLTNNGDRNLGNVLIQDDGRLLLIDNAHAFRPPEEKSIASAFIPNTGYGKAVASNPLTKKLSYTSHVDKIGKDFLPEIQKVIDSVVDGGVDFAKKEYDLTDKEASAFHRRCTNMKIHGFEKALEMEVGIAKASLDKKKKG